MTGSYSRLSIALHWVMAALIATAYLIGSILEDLPRGSPDKAFALGVHLVIGVVILGLVVVRVIARRTSGTPAAPAVGWQEKAAKAVHHGLYAVMVLVPVTGLITVMLGKNPFVLFDWLTLPCFGPAPTAHEVAEETHEALTSIILVLVGIHVAATAWHAVVLRDDVAGRMLPFLRRLPADNAAD